MFPALLLPLLLAAQDDAPPAPLPYRPAAATVMVEPVAMMLAGFDADGDGVVTRAEAMRGVERSFAGADGTASGSIGYIAFADWAQRWLGDRNAVPSPFEVDRDGDNRITLDELRGRIDAIFTRLDGDKDGRLTHSELLTIRKEAFGERPGTRKGERRERRPRLARR